MEEVYVVRHRHLVEGIPIRQLAREMGIDRKTIRRYLMEPSPGRQAARHARHAGP